MTTVRRYRVEIPEHVIADRWRVGAQTWIMGAENARQAAEMAARSAHVRANVPPFRSLLLCTVTRARVTTYTPVAEQHVRRGR